ncbi:adenosine receptor A1-like isoform X2 [Entelurus aequoreus]|uniref:adenosine receptor A1-like isoform X2 n=1 Tax=Entelurus aequoreus TaxID=161455 RepID=UPI002B1D817C|nr:adenosine receptor A1-like isoform X2 [Entelurus aequoreus]
MEVWRQQSRYSTIVTQRRAYGAVVLCWMVSFLTGLVPMMGWNNRRDPVNLSHNDSVVCKFTNVMTMKYMVYFNFFGWVVAPLLIMIALYGELFRVICRQLNRRAEATSDGERYYRKELKLAKSLALVVLLFVVCWLPLHIMNCVNVFYKKGSIPQPAIKVGIFMSHVNSALNPLVYAFRIKSFRVTLLEITRRCTSCKAREPSPYPCSMPVLTEKVPHDPTESAK